LRFSASNQDNRSPAGAYAAARTAGWRQGSGTDTADRKITKLERAVTGTKNTGYGRFDEISVATKVILVIDPNFGTNAANAAQ
jgi:hypothetical protein